MCPSLHPIMTRHVPSPTPDQMATWVYKYLIRHALVKHMKDNCLGCFIDHPSQVKHMREGCLTPWYGGLDFIDDVRPMIDLASVNEHYQGVWRAIAGGEMQTHTLDLKEQPVDNLFIPEEYLAVFIHSIKLPS